MSAIQIFLEKIKTAIYGEEVRGSIHDAIEQCYKDATGNPESVAAVVEQNNRMADLLENTPYTTAIEETDTFNLPVHTIRDDVTTETSTWSSAKIQEKLDELVQVEVKDKFIIINGNHDGISNGSFIEKKITLGTVAALGRAANLQVIFAGQDQRSRYESPSGNVDADYQGVYQPMAYSEQAGMDGEQISSTITPMINSVTESNGNIVLSLSVTGVGTSFDLEMFYDVKYRIILMKLA